MVVLASLAGNCSVDHRSMDNSRSIDQRSGDEARPGLNFVWLCLLARASAIM